MRLIKTTFVIFFLLLAATASAQQNLQDIDFQNMNVENLSDQQIRQIYEESQARGLSIDQTVQLAVSRGMPQSQANALRRRLQQAQSRTPAAERGAGISGRMRIQEIDTARANFFDRFFGADTGRDSLQFYQTIESIRYKIQQDSVNLARQKLKDKIFGFELFTDRTVNFQPSLNIPTPENYQLGPGDELIIDIWGAAQNTYQLQVTPEGTVLIQNIGPVNVNGYTIEHVSTRLKERLGEIYSGLNPENPEAKDTFIQVSLGQVRSIKVTVLGEVTIPGTYTVPSLATVFNALYSAGGPTVSGSFRRIEVVRGNSVVSTFDLYDLLVNGEQSGNIRLKDQDIIRITPYQNRVEVEGEVKRPGIYETKDNETLDDLVEFAGGFTGNAYTGRIKVIGNTPREKQIADVRKANFNEYNLKNGDHVTVGKVLDRYSNLVEIEGAVYRPGQYEVSDTTTLYSLIQRADGLKGDAFMNRGIIYRTKDDFTIEAISFSVRELMQNPEEHDIPLRKDDVVRISSIFDLREEYTVSISGPIQQPDQYKYVYGMTLEDLIYQSGGFQQSADPYRIEVARRVRNLEDKSESAQIADIFTFSVDENLQLNPEDADFELEPFDQVYVRSLPNYEQQSEVSIVGQIRYPGTYSISSKNERISDLIQRAGGLTTEAYLQGATLYRKREFTEQETQQTLANVEGLTLEEQQQQIFQQQVQQASQGQEEAQVGIDLPEVIRNPGSKFDLLLEEGDSLYIPKQLQTVTVKGGVFYPTTIRFEDNRSFKDYITSAGGFTDLAKKKRAYVIYANGDVDRAKNFLFFKNYPNVEPGATIVVPEKPERTRMSPQERISMYSAIASTAAVITGIIVNITRITNN
jgi:protein involved in polysaccharide export with SLBB domain